MGAALTYARRYALFTLVGIAGEDDVDAPDLAAPQQQSPGPERSKGNGALDGGKLHAPYPAPGRSTAKIRSVPREPALGSEASAGLRDRLLRELNELASGDDAALWAHRSLAEKNKLITADADRVEQAFQARMAPFAPPAEPNTSRQTEQSSKPHRSKPAQPKKRRSQPKGIDKSTLLLAESRRVRDREHVRYVAKQPCLICGRDPSDPHHLRFAQTRALGRKVSDEFVVPLCRGHHRELHRHGDEGAWWRNVAIDPMIQARALWLETHPVWSRPPNLPVEGRSPLPHSKPTG
jgi:ERF superfamily